MMIKFRNPSSSLRTQFLLLRAIDREFDGCTFGLNDFARVATSDNLMTAYGFTGEKALSVSQVADTSRNSTFNNAKQTAELFRILGWFSSCQKERAYPVMMTELGRYVARSQDPLPIYKQCLFGICSPQEIMTHVKYKEQVRCFRCILETFVALGGVMYKHELCMGPMSCNDVNQNDVQEMLDRLRSMRGSFRLYKSGWAQFCASLRMKEYSVDNQTRFPRAALAGCGWVEECMSKDIYPPSNMKCLRITDEGRKALSGISELKDLRLEEFNQCTGDVQDSLIRLGFYQLLGRSGYDLSIVQESLDRDADIAKDVTGGKELLFSPFQVLSCSRVNRALDIDTTGYRDAAAENKVQLSDRSPRATTMLLKANDDSSCKFSDGSRDAELLQSEIAAFAGNGASDEEIEEILFDRERHSNQDRFYPLIGAMFRILGFDCRVSRQGDNGSRMDAIIVGPGDAIPIEIKSPGEEELISVKGIKQAAENKIIMLSRQDYQTSADTVSLVVGYKAPNERAEVASLIEAFRSVFGINIGVISFDVLVGLVVECVTKQKTISVKQLQTLKGFANVAE